MTSRENISRYSGKSMFSRSSATRSNALSHRLFLALALLSTMPLLAQEGTYQSARQAMVQGRTEEAIQGFCSLGQYKDAAGLCMQLRAQLANLNRQNEENFQNGVRAFQAGINAKIPAAINAGAKPPTQAGTAGPQVTQPAIVAPPAKNASPRTIKPVERAAKPAVSSPVKAEARTEVAPATPTTEAPAEGPPAAPTALAADVETLLADGIRNYYDADFTGAEAKLKQYLDAGGQRRGAAEFYLGASKLTRFYLAGPNSEDAALLADAKNAFRLASKVEGFTAPETFVSPKIIDVYKTAAQ
jgi:TolA-binding protein